jgi:hypothetical protein
MYPAQPSLAKQAPDFNALMKNTILVLESQQLATPAIAQEYFEPGINHKLTRRSKPKTDYTLPSDMPKYPMGFVPINQTPGANGEEMAIIRVPESQPQDLLDVFAKISKEQGMAPKLPEGSMDAGTKVSEDFMTAVTEARQVRKVDAMMRNGFSEEETKKAMAVIRDEDALKMARRPAAPLSLKEAMMESYGVRESMDPVESKPARVNPSLSVEMAIQKAFGKTPPAMNGGNDEDPMAIRRNGNGYGQDPKAP